MDMLTLDVGQWDMLERSYRLYISHIMPFTRTVLDDYFRKHSKSDRTVETVEELDAIISLCEVCMRDSKRIKYDIEDSNETRSVPEERFLEEEAYTDLMSLLNRLFEQREQYRLLHLKENVNRNLSRQV